MVQQLRAHMWQSQRILWLKWPHKCRCLRTVDNVVWWRQRHRDMENDCILLVRSRGGRTAGACIILSISFSLWLVQQSAAERQAHQIAVPAEAGQVTCTVGGDSERRPPVVSGEKLIVGCPAGSPRSILSCTAEAAEPLDLPLDEACRRDVLPLVLARKVIVEAEDGASTPTTVEWLIFPASGDLEGVAARTVTQYPAIIRVGVLPDRLVRFLRSGSAPVTTSAAELTAFDQWRLPRPQPGGEVIIRRSSAPIVPLGYRLTGPGGVATYPHGGATLLTLRGLPDGRYHLTPIYEGGVHGAELAVQVADGASTPVTVPAEAVGGATVDIWPQVCTQVRRVRILRLVTRVDNSGPIVRSATVTREIAAKENGPCQQTVTGLSPHEYEVVLEGESSVVARRRFDVTAGTITPLLFAEPKTIVSGTLTLNDRPFRGVAVQFFTGTDRQPDAEAHPDERGAYAAELRDPGTYRVSLSARGVPLLGQDRALNAVEGENVFDIKVVGGTLELKFENLHKPVGGRVQIRISAANPQPVTGGWTRGDVNHFVDADDPLLADDELVLPGIGLAEYVISATQEGLSRSDPRRITDTVAVALTESRLEASAILRFRENTAELLLTNRQGDRVPRARVYGMGSSAREVEPGMYSLDRIAPGTALQVRAGGYTPTCHVASGSGRTELVLDVGRTVEVRFPGLAPGGGPPGEISGGSLPCPVSLAGFPYVELPADTDGARRVRLSNFPQAYQFIHTILGRNAQPIAVAGDVFVVPFRPVTGRE